MRVRTKFQIRSADQDGNLTLVPLVGADGMGDMAVQFQDEDVKKLLVPGKFLLVDFETVTDQVADAMPSHAAEMVEPPVVVGVSPAPNGYVSDDAKRTHEKYAHLLPATFGTKNPAGHTCQNSPDGACHCVFELKRGEIHVQWSNQDGVDDDGSDSIKYVYRILGHVMSEHFPDLDTVVARVLACSVPKMCDQLVFFAPDSLSACWMVPVTGIQQLTPQWRRERCLSVTADKGVADHMAKYEVLDETPEEFDDRCRRAKGHQDAGRGFAPAVPETA